MTNFAATARPYPEPVGLEYRQGWPGLVWSPVMAGVVTAIAAQLLFTVLGMAIGVTVSETSADPDAGTFGTMASIWWLISGTVSLIVGGMVMGRLWHRTIGVTLHLHAVTLWAVVALFGFLVIWSGAGMATNAASPMATLVGERDNGSQARPIAAETDFNTTQDSRTITNPTPQSVEHAQSAARTASWWSVIGLLLGIAASVIGAVIGARQALPDGRVAPDARMMPAS
jgi:hypothetical protein